MRLLVLVLLPWTVHYLLPPVDCSGAEPSRGHLLMRPVTRIRCKYSHVFPNSKKKEGILFGSYPINS